MKKVRTVYLVIYGNYWPSEVESVWSNSKKAQQRIDALGGEKGGWRIYEIPLDDAEKDFCVAL